MGVQRLGIRATVYFFFIFLIIPIASYSQDQKSFLINNLIEKDGKILRPFTNEEVYGDIYRYFLKNNERSEKVFVGLITEKGKQGHWTRWWENGQKREEGYYVNSKKDGLWIQWMENGQKYAEIFYRDGNEIHLTNCILDSCL